MEKFLKLTLLVLLISSCASKTTALQTPTVIAPVIINSAAAAARPNQSAIENGIDRVVNENIQKQNFLMKLKSDLKHWQSVFKALAFAESSLVPTTRYVEPPSLGKDAVTGVQNTSEGLLQMSYQDSKYHGCEFDWAIDKTKSKTDSTKTIFDLEKNIKCGLVVMNKLTGRNGNYIFNTSNYWAVLKPNNKRHKEYLTKYKAYMSKE